MDVARDLLAWLESESISIVIVGGVAVSLIARPRMTKDIDAMIWIDTDFVESFIQTGAKYGFVSRSSDPVTFVRLNRMVVLSHPATGVDVDLSCGAMPFDSEMIARARTISIGSLKLKVATPEDLIVMKMMARRPRDIADIEAILNVNPDLDLERIRYWVREFAAVVEMPEIVDELEKLLSDSKPTSSKRRKS